MLIQLNAGAVQSPGLTVIGLDGKLASSGTLLQTAGHSLRGLVRFFLRRGALSHQSDRAKAQAKNGDQPKSQLCDLVRHDFPPDFLLDESAARLYDSPVKPSIQGIM